MATLDPSVLDADVTCIECGYNLRGLSGRANCPECGRPLTASLARDLLRFAEPAWLLRVTLGGETVALGLLVMFVANATTGFGWTGAYQDATMATLLLTRLPILAGAWLATTPEPLAAKSTISQRITRVAVVIMAAGALAMLAQLALPIDLPRELQRPLVAWGAALFQIVFWVAAAAFFRHCSRLMARVPSADLRDDAGRFAWLSAIAAVGSVLYAARPLLDPPTTGAWDDAMAVVEVLYAVFALVLFGVYFVWQNRASRVIRAQHALAREFWPMAPDLKRVRS